MEKSRQRQSGSSIAPGAAGATRVTSAPITVVDFSAAVADLLVKSTKDTEAVGGSPGAGHLQDALSVAMARTKVLEDQLDAMAG